MTDVWSRWSPTDCAESAAKEVPSAEVSPKDPVISCGVALIRRDGKYLISQRCEEDSFGSFWEFPGGKLDPGESLPQCVEREVREELGIEVKAGRFFMKVRRRYKRRVIELHFYTCEYLSGEPQAIECQKFVWAEPSRLKDYTFPPANERVIRRLLQEEGR